MIEWFNEQFAPGALFLTLSAAFVVLVPLVWYRARSRRRRPTVRFSSLEPLSHLGTGSIARTRFVLPMLRTAAVVALVIALLRPQSGDFQPSFGLYRLSLLAVCSAF